MRALLLKKSATILLLMVALIAVPAKGLAQIIGWDTTGITGFGPATFTPVTLNPHLTTSGLKRGTSIGTGGNSAASCWGGAGGWAVTQSDDNSFYFTFQASAGYKVSLTSISSATRRSNAGPSGCAVWYSVGGRPFVNAVHWNTTATSGTTGTANSFSLSGIPALQDIPENTVVKFRIIPDGSTTGNYYITGATNSLKIDGTVEVAASPLITPSTTSLASFGNVIVGNTSAAQSFTFDAAGLTQEVTIIAPSGFEISTDNVNWFGGTDVDTVLGSLDDYLIWVRFRPSVAGPYTGNIVLASSGAEDKTVSVSGTGISVGLGVAPTSINTLSYIENEGPSAAFQLTRFISSGLAPSSGTIDITPALAASNYELSTDGISWNQSIQFPYTASNNNINNPAIYVRLKAGLAAGEVAAEQINVVGGSFTTSFTVAGNVYPAGMILNQSFCGSATVSQLSAPGSSILWYTAPAGGSALAPTQALATGSYYVSLNGGSRIEVSVTINSFPALPVIAAQSLCAGALVDNLVVVSGDDIRWYSGMAGGTALSDDTILSTGTYYASQTVNGCESARRSVLVAINALPEAPAALPQSFCDSATVADLVPVAFNGTGNPPISENWAPLVAYGFSGQQTMGGTGATGLSYYFTNFTRSPSAPIPVMTAIETLSSFAQLKSITITAAAPNDSPSGNNKNIYVTKIVNGIETPLTTLVLTATLTSYTVMVNGYGSGIHIKIAKDPAMSVFQMQYLNFSFYQSGEGVNWYSGDTAATPMLPADALTSGAYYVSQLVNGCESPRSPVNVAIITLTQPQGPALQDYIAGETLADLDITGSNLIWYASPDLSGTPLPATTVLVSGITYYVVQSQGDCRSEALAVTVNELNAEDFRWENLNYYPNPMADAFTMAYTSEISSVAVYNILGQQVIAENPNQNTVKINTMRLAPGTYFVKVTSNDRSKTVKVIKR